MSQAKDKRVPKRQKGQFLTPQPLALDVLSDIEFKEPIVYSSQALERGPFSFP